MAGYIGSKSSVTQVDGYSEAEADAEFVTKTGDTMSGNLDVTGTVTGSTGITTGVNHGNFTPVTSGTTGARINANGNGMLRLASGGVDKMYVLDSGNVGIGTSSTDNKVNIQESSLAGRGASNGNTSMTLEHATDTGIQFFSAGQTQLRFGDAASTGAGSIIYEHATDKLRLNTGSLITFEDGGVERMRIDSSGRTSGGETTNYRGSSNDGLGSWSLGENGNLVGAVYQDIPIIANRMGNDGYAVSIRRRGTQIGGINISGTTTQYITSSDYRLKENVVDLTGASARVNQLDVKRFNWIADDTNTAVDGFLAHEVATVVPEAINGTKDAMRDEEYEVTPATGDIYTPATDDVDEVIHSADAEQPETLEDGQQWRETTAAVMGTRSVPDYQGIDQSKLVPLLTAALQEALTEIASLKTRVEALEA